jgi:excisionase family DNA binding protein
MSTSDQENARQDKLITAKEAAAYLRVGRVTVWRWCQQGLIPAFRVGRTWRIRHSELLRLGEQRDDIINGT